MSASAKHSGYMIFAVFIVVKQTSEVIRECEKHAPSRTFLRKQLKEILNEIKVYKYMYLSKNKANKYKKRLQLSK